MYCIVLYCIVLYCIALHCIALHCIALHCIVLYCNLLYIILYELSSFSNLSVTSPASQLILQPFRRFTYITAHSSTLPLLHLRHSSFSNPSFASRTSQALHLIHMASRPRHVHVVKIISKSPLRCTIIAHEKIIK